MATYTFKGKIVTGTSEGNFKVPGAKRNNTYLNVQTGHVYICTEVHTDWASPGWSKWKYQRTDLIGTPNQGVYGLAAPTIGNGDRAFTAKWSQYDWQKNAQNGRRMTNQYRRWQVNTVIGRTAYPLRIDGKVGISGTETTIWLTNFKVGNTTYNRASFFPLTNRVITSVSCTVWTWNEKGYGPSVVASRALQLPREPVISEPSFNSSNGHLSFTITTDPGNDYRERYDTRYKMTVVNTRVSDDPVVVSDTSSTSTEFPVEYDAQDYMQMSYDDYIKVTVEAWARGLRGESKHVSRIYYISYPAKASITGAEISSEDSTGKCTVFINTNASTEHPVDGVKLEYLANVTYASPSEIPGDGVDWKDTGIVDDAECTALSVSVTELIPERGKYTWLRIKSWHASEGNLYRYSEFKDILHKEPASAQTSSIAVISAEPAKDGKSIAVQLGWNADGQDEATGTELSWSNELDTWKSTKDPDKYEFTWSDGRYPATGTLQYHDSAYITIKGLQEGEKYYIKARRYLEGDTVTYSAYSDHKDCMTSEIPESIVAVCDKFVAKGSSLPVYWTFAGNGIQTRWQIERKVNNQTESVVLANGEGSTGFAQIPAERLDKNTVDNSITIRVGASTGSEFVWSDWKAVSIVSAPTLSVNMNSTLTVQPFSFTATASKPCRLLVIVSSDGASGQFPTGKLTQTAGDTIHSDVYEPEWTASQNGFTTTVTLPRGLDFWNLGHYQLLVTAIDDSTGLSSEIVTKTFSVAWSHEAADPTGDDENIYVTLTPIDETDDTGQHRKAVQIDLTAPEGTVSTDVYDIYRLSGDGAQLIGEGFPLNYTAVDEYAPFGEDLTLYYRIAIRTQDGDIAYSDFEYVASGKYLRFDWDGYSLELPYNLSIGESYKKSVDIRQHMDGSSDGYWNQNIERSGSLSTDVIRLEQPNEISLAKQLARYPGVVFVRTPNGDAYEADVQVTNLSATHKNLTSVAIDATEVGLTQEFMLPVPETEEEEE